MSAVRRLLTKLRNSSSPRIGSQLARAAAVAISPNGRSAARRSGLPMRYWWARTAAIGTIDGPPGALAGSWTSDRRLDLVLIGGAGGPLRLIDIAEQLITCERHSTPTVLIASSTSDLDTEVAGVCRYIATDDHRVADESRRRFGIGRTVLVDRPDRWLATLIRLTRQ